MIKRFTIALLLLLSLSTRALFAQNAATTTTVTIDVTGVKTGVGTVVASICDKKKFLVAPCTYSKAAPAHPGNITFVFNSVPAGRYAATAFQDLDGNGDLKITLTGPGEPAGFSGPKTMIPNFEKAAFDVGTEPMTVNVALK